MLVEKNGLSMRPTVRRKSCSDCRVLVLQEGAIEPDCVFAEIAALAAVGEPRVWFSVTGESSWPLREADARREAVLQVNVRPDAGADAEALAVLVDVVLR